MKCHKSFELSEPLAVKIINVMRERSLRSFLVKILKNVDAILKPKKNINQQVTRSSTNLSEMIKKEVKRFFLYILFNDLTPGKIVRANKTLIIRLSKVNA